MQTVVLEFFVVLTGSVLELYQVFAIPTGPLINAEGVIQAKLIESVTPELLTEKLTLIGIQP